MNQKYTANQNYEPTEKQMLKLLGKKASFWSSLREYLASNYPEYIPVFTIEGKDCTSSARMRQIYLQIRRQFSAPVSIILQLILFLSRIVFAFNCFIIPNI